MSASEYNDGPWLMYKAIRGASESMTDFFQIQNNSKKEFNHTLTTIKEYQWKKNNRKQ